MNISRAQTNSSRIDDKIQAKEDQFFIPDLCQINNVLFLLILTQILALILGMVTTQNALIDWQFLGLLSVFCHLIALSCAAVICISRPYIQSKSLRFVAFYFIIANIFITSIFSVLGSHFLFIEQQSQFPLFTIKSILISGIISILILRYFYLQFQWKEQKQAELRSRIQALQARIRPHFLFNSMNSIASLISINPQQAEDAVIDLSALFRATLNTQTSLISLKNEIALCRRYLNIESLRLGGRLTVDWQLDPKSLEVDIPPLTLQPLVENAIYHGVQPLTEGGTITIKTNSKQGVIYILVSNPYIEQKTSHQGNHIALENIASRLTAIFGESAIMKTSKLDGVFTVTLRFPIKNSL